MGFLLYDNCIINSDIMYFILIFKREYGIFNIILCDKYNISVLYYNGIIFLRLLCILFVRGCMIPVF